MLKKYFLFIIEIGILSCAPKADKEKPISDPLPSWNEGTSKSDIIEFVQTVVNVGGADYVPAAERIAVFDNDGTIWAEQPMYFQLIFAIDRVKAMATEHPEWSDQDPFKSILNEELQGVMASGIPGLLKIVMETHAGIATEEFERIVKAWASTTKHTTLKCPFTELVYQPMLELLEYLRANDFKTYIVFLKNKSLEVPSKRHLNTAMESQ